MNEEYLTKKVDLLGSKLAEVMIQLAAAQDLIGVLLGELAYAAPPEQRLDRLIEIIEAENEGVYKGVVQHDDVDDTLTKTLIGMNDWKQEAYQRARHILERVDLARA